MSTTEVPKAESPAESPKSKLARQRAKDRVVQRVRKIEWLATACSDASMEAQVSFGFIGIAFPLSREQSQRLAAAMLEDALKEHDADPHAGDLPKDLQWVREIADAAKPKSPSMKPEIQPKKKGQTKTPTKGSSSPEGDD